MKSSGASLGSSFPTRRGVDPRTAQTRSLSATRAWGDRALFYEYFNGDTGEGLGASHQSGWTALVAAIIAGRNRRA